MGVAGKVLTVDSLPVHYLEGGDGPTVVLLHGADFGTNAGICWEANLAPLSERFHVVAPDLLGYGKSAKVVNFEDSRQFRIDHLWRFLEQLDLGAMWLVGNSAGASTGLEFAAMAERYPGVAGVVAVSGGGTNIENAARQLLNDYDGSRGHMQLFLRELFEEERFSEDPYLSRRYEESLAPGTWEVFASGRLPRRGAPHQPRLRTQPDFTAIAVPTLLIGGEADRLKPVNELRELAQLISDCELVIFEGCRHYPHIEKAEEFNAIVTRFIEAHQS